MDAQIDYAAGMPIGLLDELQHAVDATDSLFTVLREVQCARLQSAFRCTKPEIKHDRPSITRGNLRGNES